MNTATKVYLLECPKHLLNLIFSMNQASEAGEVASGDNLKSVSPWWIKTPVLFMTGRLIIVSLK